MNVTTAFTALAEYARRIRTGVAHEEPLLSGGPLRGEPLGAERLAERATELAREQRVRAPRTGRLRAPLLARLNDTERVLLAARAELSAYAADAEDLGPAGEWLLDNFHVIEEHIREVRESLPRGYYAELPVLDNGPLEGYPRVYEVAITLISHTEARVDLDSLSLFIAAFQAVAPLAIGELWAIPAMLRLGSLESVRRMTLRTVERSAELNRADKLAEHIRDVSSGGPSAVRFAVNEALRTTSGITPVMNARLFQQLRTVRGAHAALLALQQSGGKKVLSAEAAGAMSTRHLALTQMMMANSIRSLLAITHADWREFVEAHSGMERVLRNDPSGNYEQMTFAVRDRYRHVVERIAKRTAVSETDVARRAIEAAREAMHSSGADPRRAHVGYHLIDDGLPALEQALHFVPTAREQLRRLVLAHPGFAFATGIVFASVGALTLALKLAGMEAGGQGAAIAAAVLFLPALDAGIAVVNMIVTMLISPRHLARLDFTAPRGIPEEYRTAVVVPVLLGSAAAANEALEHLEVQFLANRDPHLHFALLSDYADSDTESRADDPEILAAMTAGVDELNDRYAPETRDAFLLLHRARKWNSQEQVWMGWERKRGKLGAFNRLVRDGANTFENVVGRTEMLASCRYVITLDADTVLPPGAAQLLVGTLAHPLNRPHYDESKGRVTRGYGILQPRVAVSLPSASRSRFAEIHAGHPGVDPYTTAVSDVYQDLFGEGSFTGKGIYDIDAFERATHGHFAENTLLSHDLIEGSYARAALVTDVVLYDDYPAHYLSAVRRKQRWIRGDWQLLPWLVPHAFGGHAGNHISPLSRWKIVDNLRRSTVEIAQLTMLFAGWVLLAAGLRWTLMCVAIIAAPWVISVVGAVLRPPFSRAWRAYYAGVGRDASIAAKQWALTVTFLPYHAWVSATAILRTLWRMGVTRRHLLEWQTASRVERAASSASGVVVRAMWPAMITGVVALRWSAVGVLWLVSPWVAAFLSRARASTIRMATAAERAVALRYAQLHWEYFARVVTEQTHWLVPDNVQEDPARVVAMRTSPTNLGLQLLATVSAHDLGFIDAEEMTVRLERAVASMMSMRRSRGHFYNWYDLTDLKVLEPAYISTADSGNLAGHLMALREACIAIGDERPSDALRERLTSIAAQADELVREMDFRVVYDDTRKLFAIGAHEGAAGMDTSCYDLLASEARLASFVAIAKGDVTVDHWFHLGRTLTRTRGGTALVSWSGSMFEYLMPVLVMRNFPQTILAQTYEGVLQRHMDFGAERGVPWGVSESAYNLRDRHLTYQYRAFGVPDLALKRGLGRDLVIAPYASLLAAMLRPAEAFANLRVLEEKGALGELGFHDAMDYTRPEPGRRYAVVRNYMAHHIGMGLVALTNVLRDDVWPQRFHSAPLVKAVELLLHERVPRRLVVQRSQRDTPNESRPNAAQEQPVVREVVNPDLPTPRIALLGRLPYTIMVSHAGSGYSRWKDVAVTRWRADGTTDDTGQFCYVKDIGSGRAWSAAHQPLCVRADRYRAALATDRVTFERTDGDVETRMEIAVAPEDAAEIRRITVTNTGARSRDLEITSYGEVVLAPPASDRVHPAFANLFVETEFHDWCSAITATRRPRAPHESRLWGVHVMSTDESRIGAVSCETDKAAFIGRGRSVHTPRALENDGPLSGTSGAVLDPVFALRARVRLAPGHSASVAFTTLLAATREQAFMLADRYHDPRTVQRALDLAWSSTQMELRELGITPADAAVFQDLAGFLLFPSATLGARMEERARNMGGQPLLWAQGISGDWPILLATIEHESGMDTLIELYAAHHYLRRRGMMVDLVILNAQKSSYLDELKIAMLDAMYASNEPDALDVPGGIFFRRTDQLDAPTLLMLRATARVHVTCDGSALASIIATAVAAASGPLPHRRKPVTFTPAAPLLADVHVPFENGHGEMTAEGEYRIGVEGEVMPPAPWVNVIANDNGGFVVSERGAGCTWAGNSYFFRLTPWTNDPVCDPSCEAIYLQDADRDITWCATPGPLRSAGKYEIVHQQGASVFEHVRDGVRSHLTMSVAPDAAAKLQVLRLTNESAEARRLTLTMYAEWALAPVRELSQHDVHTTFDRAHSAIIATNRFEAQFAGWAAFAAMSEPLVGWTCDRREFLGRNGSTSNPRAIVERVPLGGACGPGFDPCAALQCVIELAPGQMREVSFLLGAAPTRDGAVKLLEEFHEPSRVREACVANVASWGSRLGRIRVRTPDAAFDAMLNHWLLYQTLGCRTWARTATYQSSGAYGFRDQLQDVLALVYAEPNIAREHIVRAAARQFIEGDVQHWWHPDTGRGVRTRFSDDLAWLPFCAARYVTVTGDVSVLDESAPFLQMRALEPHEHEVYDLPQVSPHEASVYEHCLHALRKACTTGAHGLPLMGTGDWNDGMNRVGASGTGESVWLAWFLIVTLRDFSVLVAPRDAAIAAELHARAEAYARAVEKYGWDGEWYRRAYFDDGTPLGSASNAECRIDSIAQSWSVIAGSGDRARQARAMQSLETHLVDDAHGLVRLLAPPFDGAGNDPGYIAGYLPGVRENGAQYTHAAVWAVQATAMLGNGDRAFELYQMLNPLSHTATVEDVHRYKVEPYVVAADVYTAQGQEGRGGWTWYTGSASWMYRVGLETLLGFTKRGNVLTIDPRVPASWPAFTIEYCYGASVYTIEVRHPGALQEAGAVITMDGEVLESGAITLTDDGVRHDVVIAPCAVALDAA